ncbi:hypothetical protein C0Z16_20845 [Paraburkholderia rhynchosiae]|uniref:Uncharacterized protein n=1 Tax=Paraburkholderia rhynchosiae TaxID=487049 RepID=A0ABX4V404_9BURK|nr:hypothetical protein C0Z16_20845 [Paraburkholderia rhynchosiae]
MTHGPDQGPAIARRAFPEVNPETFKGWVAVEKRDARKLAERVAAEAPMPARGPGRPPLDVAPMPMPVTEIKAISNGRHQLARSATSRTPVSFFDRYDELERDLAKVRSACIRVDPTTGNERIVNPAALLLCVREGRANLKLQMEHSEAAHTIDRLTEMTEAMVQIVSTAINEFPEAQRRPAVERIRALVEKRKAQMERVDPEMANALTGFCS